jgi:hypothetical protein
VRASGPNKDRSCLGCPGCPPILRFSCPGGGGGGGGLTISEDGGLEEVEELLRAAASCSSSRVTIACSVSNCARCCSNSARWCSSCACKRQHSGRVRPQVNVSHNYRQSNSIRRPWQLGSHSDQPWTRTAPSGPRYRSGSAGSTRLPPPLPSTWPHRGTSAS